MRVTVLGASGFLGRPVARAFRRAGHDVRGVVRSANRIPVVVADGGEPFLGDILDQSSMERAVRGADLVVHLASAPGGVDLASMRKVRVDGATTLMAAARTAHVARVIVGSGYWVYAGASGVLTEDSPMDPMSISQVNRDAECAALDASAGDGPGIVLVRPGMVYGNGSWFAEMVRELRHGTYQYIDEGENLMAPIDAEDLGEAFRTIGEKATAPGTFLAVDDAPVSVKEFSTSVAHWIGIDPPGSIPLAEATGAWGRELALLNAASRPASNARLRGLGWAPKFPRFTDGVPELLRKMAQSSSPTARPEDGAWVGYAASGETDRLD
jgi:nucleoside-diphosphate-sugar epimerase